MIPTSLSYCDCCRRPIARMIGDNCEYCGYPIDPVKEEQFLASSLLALDRVAMYGGANVTVSQLIQRYRMRLKYLQVARPIAVEQATQNPLPFEAPVEAPTANVSPMTREIAPSIPPLRLFSAMSPPVVPPPVQRSPATPPLRTFSLGSFLEEQTINIVASLGAFLILIGSLSFIATTSNLLLSFLVLFAVHAVFGGIGMFSYRFRSFRTVAIIYTAIFALLVPLVGFSAYRLVAGNLVHLSTPTLIALAATYALFVYGALAVYQKFSLAGYLAVVALAVAVLATASVFKLGYWWWPGVLMLPALPALFALPRRPGDVRPFVDPWTILREPIQVFMWICVAVCVIGIPTLFCAQILFASRHMLTEIHLALFCMAFLLFCWNCGLIWRTQNMARAITIPYLFLLSALAFAYALSFDVTGYVLVLTGVALLYHGLMRLIPPRIVQTFKQASMHMEWLALALVALVPFIAVPLLPIYLIQQAYMPGVQRLPLSAGLIVELSAIIAGLALTISVVLRHTGFQKVPAAASTRWRWLLLFSGFLLNVVYAILILLQRADPLWWLLGLGLALVIAAVAVRRLVGTAWAHPLEVLALVEIMWMLLFSFDQEAGRIIAVWFFVVALLYAAVLYQHRAYVLFLPVLFALPVIYVLFARTEILFMACLVLPLAAAGVRRLISNRWNVSHADLPIHKSIMWEWPLLAIGVIYALMFSLYDVGFASTSTVEGWLHIVFPASLELTAIAICWYAAAALARVKWWSSMMVGCVVVALLIPSNPFWVLAWLAPILMLPTLGVSRWAGRGWAIPLYIVAVFSAVMMGVTGHNQGQVGAATWVLLLFAVIIYLIGLFERVGIGIWIAPIFAIWSVFYSGQLGDLYRPPIVALACAALGVGIGCLRFLLPQFSDAKWKAGLRYYALPLYVTACASALLTGVYGGLAGVDAPFFAAIPTAMLVYALVAYGVVLFERSAGWQWLVCLFALWGILLLPLAASCLNAAPSRQALTLACSVQGSGVLYYLTGIVLLAGILSFLAGQFSKRGNLMIGGTLEKALRAKFRWSWSWCIVVLVALLTLIVWGHAVRALLPSNLLMSALYLLIGFTLLLTLLERVPEMLLVPIALTAWAIAQLHFWPQMIGYSLLCICVFAAQFIWRVLKPELRIVSPARLYQGLSIIDQVLVVLTIVLFGWHFPATGVLAHVGAGALFLLAALIFSYGLLDPDSTVRSLCNYGAGLVVSLVVSWEFSVFGLNQLDQLTLAPAVYLIVVAPFLARADELPRHRFWGRFSSIVGAGLLLLPILGISFSEGNLVLTLILAGEALALLLLGIFTRIRIFVLTGAILTVVGAMYALFLPSLGIPTSLALAILGITLLALATVLSLTRRRVKVLWQEWV